MSEDITLYHAAPLFSLSQTSFNSKLAKKLEEIYKVISPQKDGFEFVNLISKIKSPEAAYHLIYLLDVGYFVPNSDFVIANLDEPIDPGVNIESIAGKLTGKQVIGYRTDIRSPYGDISSELGGIHVFPAYDCDVYIREQSMEGLVQKIKDSIETLKHVPTEKAEYPKLKKIIEMANYLFNDVEDIHSDTGLDEITKRYIEKQEQIKSLIVPILV